MKTTTLLRLACALSCAACTVEQSLGDRPPALDAGSANSADGGMGAESGPEPPRADGGAPPCVSDTAAECAGKCGTFTGRCGAVVTCGGCPDGQSCGGGGANVCGTATCAPTCSGKACGVSDGCSAPCTCSKGVLLFGGMTFDGLHDHGLGDTWIWDGASWMQYQGSGPSARWGAVMATVGSTVVLFGGADWGVQFEETWLWDAQGWHLSSAQGPPWEAADAMAALHGNAIMVGNGQTWQWTGSAWIRRTVPGPSIRGGHRMATLGDKIVLFGGAHDVTQSQTTYYHDTWEWDGNTWTQKSDAGPSGRSGHAMATVGDKILLFGGYGEAGGLSDTWAWDGSSWTQLATTGPLSHYSHGMASIGRKAFIFGGWHGFDLLADTWAWDGAAWTQALAPGPSPRAVPAMVTLP